MVANSEPHTLPNVHVVIKELVMSVHNVGHAVMSRPVILLLTVTTGHRADDGQFVTVCAAVAKLRSQSLAVNSVLVAHRHGGEGELHHNTEDFKILIFSCG